MNKRTCERVLLALSALFLCRGPAAGSPGSPPQLGHEQSIPPLPQTGHSPSVRMQDFLTTLPWAFLGAAPQSDRTTPGPRVRACRPPPLWAPVPSPRPQTSMQGQPTPFIRRAREATRPSASSKATGRAHPSE